MCLKMILLPSAADWEMVRLFMREFWVASRGIPRQGKRVENVPSLQWPPECPMQGIQWCSMCIWWIKEIVYMFLLVFRRSLSSKGAWQPDFYQSNLKCHRKTFTIERNVHFLLEKKPKQNKNSCVKRIYPMNNLFSKSTWNMLDFRRVKSPATYKLQGLSERWPHLKFSRHPRARFLLNLPPSLGKWAWLPRS